MFTAFLFQFRSRFHSANIMPPDEISTPERNDLATNTTKTEDDADEEFKRAFDAI